MKKIDIHEDRPVVIAGPTASGKSALALEIAVRQGGIIINADALQVFSGWRILTARPDDADLARAEHALYGHVPFDQAYSVGTWLRDLEPFLEGARPIIVGGTGLYLSALTEGLNDIPATHPDIRARGDALALDQLLEELDTETATKIDQRNRARVQRAWEVLVQTGRSLADWQDEPTVPRLPLSDCTPILLDAPKDWLTPRIAKRFDLMLEDGALEEAQQMLPNWSPDHASSKAIGAPELIAHLHGQMSLEEAKETAIIATRQYAKRQRTWFAKRMRAWQTLSCSELNFECDFAIQR